MNIALIIASLCLIASAHTAAHADVLHMRASWYGPKFHGKLMANGKPFDMHDPTVVAHRKLKFGTTLRLTNPETHRSIVAIVQDRGPYVPGRSLDVSKAAAEALDFVEDGVTELTVEVLSPIP